MSVGGYGGFSDVMRCDAMMLCCWLAVGLIEEELEEKAQYRERQRQSFHERESVKGRVGFKKIQLHFFCFLFFKLC